MTTIQPLPNRSLSFQNDVYVIGNFEFSATGITNAYYWKNGTPVKLSNDYSYANGIVGVTY